MPCRATPGCAGGTTTRRRPSRTSGWSRRTPPVRDEPEFELLDTGVFDDDRYWAVDVAYAKASPTEVLARITVENHGPEEATLSVLPTLWFRNTWRVTGEEPPALFLDGDGIAVEHPRLAGYRLDAAPAGGVVPQAVFCDNETNTAHVRWPPAHRLSEGRHQRPRGLRRGDGEPRPAGHQGGLVVPADACRPVARPSCGCGCTARSRSNAGSVNGSTEHHWATSPFDETTASREREADEFYSAIAPADTDPERMRVLRQACAGLVWSKQMYPYRVNRWLDGDPGQPPPPAGHRDRPEHRVAAPGLLRRAGDAGPVGVPVVRRLGPGVPHHSVGAPGPGVRQVPAAGAAAGVVPAPERRPARPTSGASTTSTRRCTRWPRSGCSSSTAAPTSTSWNGSSTSCC